MVVKFYPPNNRRRFIGASGGLCSHRYDALKFARIEFFEDVSIFLTFPRHLFGYAEKWEADGKGWVNIGAARARQEGQASYLPVPL